MKIRVTTASAANTESIKVNPTWADLTTVRLLRGREHEWYDDWGLRVPLKRHPMPRPGQWVTIHRLDGDKDEVLVDEVLGFDSEYAYCTVVP